MLSCAHYMPVVEVDEELLQDIKRFCRYAQQLNGVEITPPQDQVDWIIESDSCLTGGWGGGSRQITLSWKNIAWPFRTRFPIIHALEAVNLVEAVATLAPAYPEGMVVQVNTDNQALVDGNHGWLLNQGGTQARH